MTIQAWLGDLPKTTFVEQYYLRLPYSSAGGAASCCKLGSWEQLDYLLRESQADVLVVRRGEQSPEPRPRSLEEAQQRLAAGWTLLVRHAERHEPGLRELARGVARDLNGPVDVHLYATPPGEFGFGWHYDAEEVFILQTAGRKEYALRKNTVHPWPLEETLPRDMQFQREIMPLMKCLLSAGDLLYIPSGYWHVAQATDEPSISLAVGVMAPAAIHVYDFLRDRLLAALEWRQRLPVVGQASPHSDEELRRDLGELLRSLSADLGRKLQDPRLLEDLLVHLRRQPLDSGSDADKDRRETPPAV